MSTKITDLRGSRLGPIHPGSVLLSKQEDLCSTSHYVEPAVNRQPGFRRELVEQITPFIINSRNFLHGELLKFKFPNPEVFVLNFHENSKISSFFQHFGESIQELKTRV